jgi:hypothetical protein
MTTWRPSKNRGFYMGPIDNSQATNDLLWAMACRGEEIVVNNRIEKERQEEQDRLLRTQAVTPLKTRWGAAKHPWTHLCSTNALRPTHPPSLLPASLPLFSLNAIPSLSLSLSLSHTHTHTHTPPPSLPPLVSLVSLHLSLVSSPHHSFHANLGSVRDTPRVAKGGSSRPRGEHRSSVPKVPSDRVVRRQWGNNTEMAKMKAALDAVTAVRLALLFLLNFSRSMHLLMPTLCSATTQPLRAPLYR